MIYHAGCSQRIQYISILILLQYTEDYLLYFESSYKVLSSTILGCHYEQ